MGFYYIYNNSTFRSFHNYVFTDILAYYHYYDFKYLNCSVYKWINLLQYTLRNSLVKVHTLISIEIFKLCYLMIIHAETGWFEMIFLRRRNIFHPRGC